MNLHRLIGRFMTEAFTDPYNPATPAIKGAVRSYVDRSNSEPSSRRRILELMPDVGMFSGYVLMNNGMPYIAGYQNIDMWEGSIIRHKYPILPAEQIFKAATANQVLTSALPSRDIYGYFHFLKGAFIPAQESSMFSDFSIYCSKMEALAKGLIIVASGKYYRAHGSPFLDGAGFQVIKVMELDAPLQTMSYVRKAGYDPVTDAYTTGGTSNISAFVEEAYLAYDHTSERFAKLAPGDRTITVKPAQAPRVGETIGTYRILAIDTDADGCSVCHCRREGA